jgi:bacteriophage HK97-gp10 putative tail-component
VQYEWNGLQVMDEVHQRISQDMQAMARDVVRIAEIHAPKRTGRLAQGIDYDWNDAELTVVFTVGASDPKLTYGLFVEYGTRYMKPYSYIRFAMQAVGPQYGINMEMAFLNTPHINNPILAHKGDFALPHTLTAKQRQHVKQHLLPHSRYYHNDKKGNVHHARLHVRKHY